MLQKRHDANMLYGPQTNKYPYIHYFDHFFYYKAFELMIKKISQRIGPYLHTSKIHGKNTQIPSKKYTVFARICIFIAPNKSKVATHIGQTILSEQDYWMLAQTMSDFFSLL